MNPQDIQFLLEKTNETNTTIREVENQSISALLSFLGIPETSEKEGETTIKILLQVDTIHIILNPEIYNKIDFSELTLPKRLVFQADDMCSNILVWGEKKFDYLWDSIEHLPPPEKLSSKLSQGFKIQH